MPQNIENDKPGLDKYCVFSHMQTFFFNDMKLEEKKDPKDEGREDKEQWEHEENDEHCKPV